MTERRPSGLVLFGTYLITTGEVCQGCFMVCVCLSLFSMAVHFLSGPLSSLVIEAQFDLSHISPDSGVCAECDLV